MSNIEQKKKYDLFCLIKKDSTEYIIQQLEEILNEKANDTIEVKKESFSLAYPIKALKNIEHQYLKFVFFAFPSQVKKIKETVLQTNVVRYIILNLEKKRNKTKVKLLREIKVKKKTEEKNEKRTQ